jgi:hypothetical protein
MGISPDAIGEFRYLVSNTMNLTHTAPDAAGWDIGTSVKLRVHNLDKSQLAYETVPDPSIQQRARERPANIETTYTTALSFDCYLEGANTNYQVTNPIELVISEIMGGVAQPASMRTDAAEAGGDTVTLKAVAHGMLVGQAVLVGTRGDGKGGGQVCLIDSVADVNTIGLAHATAVAAAATDAIVYGTTCYWNTDVAYFDFLYVGRDSTSPDQFQTLGCVGNFTIETAEGGLPVAKFSFQGADWREVDTGDKETLDTSTAMSGDGPAADRNIGGFYIQDHGTTTRNTMQVANVMISANIEYAPIPDLNGVNGIGGFVKTVSAPTLEFDALYGDTDVMPGLEDDLHNGTAKQVLIQYGHAAANCVAVDFPMAYVDSVVRTEVEGLAGVHVVMHGDEDTNATDRISSSMRVHTF